MLDYRENSWVDGASLTGKYSNLAFSRADRFRLCSTPKKRLTVVLAAFGADSINLMRIASSGHMIDVTDEGSFTVMMPSTGSLEVTVDGKSHQASSGNVLCFGPSRRRTLVARGNEADFQAYLLKVPISTCLPRLCIENASLGSRDPVVPVEARAAHSLRDLVGYVFSDLESPAPSLATERASRLAEALVREQFLALVEPGLRPKGGWKSASDQKVRQAEAFMQAHYAEPLRLDDIAGAVGVSSRSLGAAFKRAANTTPSARLMAIRLENTRQRLLAGNREDSVTSIALECGFAHLGRFSQLYKKAYGELPSKTMSRSR